METPSSMRRVTRSQSKGSINNIPMSRQKNSKSDRSALLDITNDSPIGGLAAGSMETPSTFAKKREQPKQTPGSGEALLRYQAKTLLQKVEEEADISKLSLENRRFLQLQGVAAFSPSGLLAPTPANTPQVLNFSGCGSIESFVSEIPLAVQVEPKIQQEEMVIDRSPEESLESEKSLITRSLLLDFSEKVESSDSCSPFSSVLTDQEKSVCQEKSTEEDDASVWSIQVNTSTRDEDEDGETEHQQEEDYEDAEEDYEEYEEDLEEGDFLDDLCDGLSKITVQEKQIPEFEGKHTRFLYNSDDEIEGEENVAPTTGSPSALCLKGLPVPEGKHLRFPVEDEE